MTVEVGQWLGLVRREYLQRFVPGGGSSIKFAVAPDDVLAQLQSGLGEFAAERGLLFATVDGAATKLHLIQEFFFALSRQVDWEGLAQRRVEAMFSDLGYVWPTAGVSAPLSEVAARNDVAETLISLNVDQWLTRRVMRDPDMTQDFREAMTHLLRRRLLQDASAASQPIIDWLRGDLRALGAIRPVPIGSKVARHNGRAMLRSLCHWLVICGCPGIVVALDIRWIAESTASPAGIRFTPAAVLDLFEVLRQLIDGADQLEGLFLVVQARPTLLDGEHRRTLDVYPALKGRIGLDVLASQHDNPLAPLVKLATGADMSAPPAPRSGGQMPFSAERVAIEALRAGVPNEAAIRLLGGADQPWSNAFVEELRSIARAGASIPKFAGRIVAGGFGSGKSHLLGYLAEHAQNQNFIVSQVSISKETPLFNLDRVFAAAIRNAIVPGINDDVMTVAIGRLDSRSSEIAQLEEWAGAADSGLSPIFPALIHVLSRNILGPEEKVAVARFFAGSRLRTGLLSQWLRVAGVRKLFEIRPVRVSELAMQRLRFAPALFRAVGFSGWCVLIDEAELIGRYSSLQRGKSYAELARWLGLDPPSAIPGVISVAAMVDDFKSVVLDGRLDMEKLPALLEARGQGDLARLAGLAMGTIERNLHLLVPPDAERTRHGLETVAGLYQRSYGSMPPPTDIGERSASKTMREYIKSWITDWDIQRLYDVKDEITTAAQTPTDFSEDKNLEAPPAPDAAGEDV